MESYPEKRLPMAKGHKYFYQLMQAVDYLHCKGIIHKDIKTANMLIDLADDIKLTDLGMILINKEQVKFVLTLVYKLFILKVCAKKLIYSMYNQCAVKRTAVLFISHPKCLILTNECLWATLWTCGHVE